MPLEITEAPIKLMQEVHEDNERFHAFSSIVFNDMFVIRDLKILEGTAGLFVAMPSKKLTDHCPYCGSKAQLLARFCSQCGERLAKNRASRREDGRLRLYADIAHPIHPLMRELIEAVVLDAYHQELARASRSGYVCRYDDPSKNSTPLT